MTNPATRKGVGDGQAQPTDWEAIEREYRAGVLTNREIARRHHISEGAIRKKAKEKGWTKDLTARVREKVRTELVRTPVRTPEGGDEARTEKEIVDDAAAAVVALVREHRADLREGREMAATLLSQLRAAAGNRDALEDLIIVSTVNADTGVGAAKTAAQAQRKAMLAAVSLPSHVGALRDLSNILKNLIPLERQAFNVDDGGPPDKPGEDAPPGEDALVLYEQRMDAFLARMRDPAVA